VQTLGQRAEEVMALADLNPKAVFLKKCEAEFGETEFTDLVETFNEVLELMAQKES
jgi:exonuclease SbcD